MKRLVWLLIFVLTVSTQVFTARAGEDISSEQAAELAKKLQNPVANLISVPIQYNYDTYGGVNDGGVSQKLLIEPVIPFSVSENMNVITRTIIPFSSQSGFPIDVINESGMGDIVASQFFSPKMPTSNGWIWGVGPAELIPTASKDVLGTEKWGAGPTFVGLRQKGPWTVGYLGSHIWSFAGNGDRDEVNSTGMQPFFSYVTKTHTALGAYTEASYDWLNDQWSVPLIVQAGQILKVGPQIFQLAVGGKYWAESPENGPKGWGLRAQVTLLFIK